MVYSGRVMDIVDLGSSPPIKRPNIIIEFKELEDWYQRVRDLKGYFSKPMTAEEWRSRWWYRLREELIKIADLQHVVEAIDGGGARYAKGREQSMRVREYQLVLMYKAVYKPDKMFLISRAKVPREIREYLESNGVEVHDGVGFSVESLRDLAEGIGAYASYGDEDGVSIEIPKSLAEMVGKAARALGTSYVEVLEHALEILLRSIEQDRDRP